MHTFKKIFELLNDPNFQFSKGSKMPRNRPKMNVFSAISDLWAFSKFFNINMFYRQNTILKEILSRNGSYRPEIWVFFTLAKTGAKRLLWRFYFLKNFKPKYFLTIMLNSMFLKSPKSCIFWMTYDRLSFKMRVASLSEKDKLQ